MYSESVMEWYVPSDVVEAPNEWSILIVLARIAFVMLIYVHELTVTMCILYCLRERFVTITNTNLLVIRRWKFISIAF